MQKGDLVFNINFVTNRGLSWLKLMKYSSTWFSGIVVLTFITTSSVPTSATFCDFMWISSTTSYKLLWISRCWLLVSNKRSSQKHCFKSKDTRRTDAYNMVPVYTDKNKHYYWKMRQLRCIATNSCRLGVPQNICHPKLQYTATRHVLFTSASINNHCLDSRWQDWPHCLTRLTKLTNCH